MDKKTLEAFKKEAKRRDPEKILKILSRKKMTKKEAERIVRMIKKIEREMR